MTTILENRTFDEIRVGDSASLTRALRHEDVETWAAVTGNMYLVHAFAAAAREGLVESGGSHGVWGTALFATIVGTQLPGPGTMIHAASVRFVRPLTVGLRVTATVTVTAKDPADGSVVLACRCVDDRGLDCIEGEIEVVAPGRKIRQEVAETPTVQLRREDRYLELIRMCEGLEPMPTAVVHPCSPDALEGALQAAERQLIIPYLVGPEAKIRSVAREAALDIDGLRIVAAEHSHHAAELAVEMVRAGEAMTLMKGSLHTDELLHAVLRKEAGLRTERRLSHVFLLAVPTRARPFILTDAAINIAPDLMTKRDICQNAIEVAHAMGMGEPRVALLAAVETVNPGMPATIDAAALCKMADRGQIRGGLLDGPLAFDNAIDEEAARIKGIVSPVAGRADILVVPDLEAGNMLAKQLTFMADAEAAGIVVGARVPVVLTSRADSARTRLASCALAVLMADHQRRGFAMLKAAE